MDNFHPDGAGDQLLFLSENGSFAKISRQINREWNELSEFLAKLINSIK